MSEEEKFEFCFKFGFWFDYFLVGRGAPVGLRAGPLWGPRRVAAPIDVEFPTAGRFGTDAAGRPPTRQFIDPRTILHRPLPMPTRQHFRIPGTYTQTTNTKNIEITFFLNNSKQNTKEKKRKWVFSSSFIPAGMCCRAPSSSSSLINNYTHTYYLLLCVCIYSRKEKRFFFFYLDLLFVWTRRRKSRKRISFFWGPAETLEAHCSSWGFVSPSGGK